MLNEKCELIIGGKRTQYQVTLINSENNFKLTDEITITMLS